jgi:hypothetical protein
MILKEKKLSIVMAFILGTTMLSSVDKAWGMDDGSDLIKDTSSSHATVAPRFFLAGTACVTDETRKAAQNLVDAFGNNPDIFTNKKGMTNLRKTLIEGSFDVRKDENMVTFFSGLARVMADLNSEKPGLAQSSLFSLSLETITLAVNEDPYDRITHGESKPVISAGEMDSIRQSLLMAKKEAKLSDFFSAELPNLVASHSTIVDSLMARYPREEEIEKLQRNLRTYFGQNNPAEPQKAAAPQPTRRRNQRQLDAERLRQVEAERQRQQELQQKRQGEFDKKLNTLAEAFYLLKQINDRPTPPSSSAPIQLEPLTASSSSTPAVTPAIPPLKLEIREFHMGKSTPFPTSGFSHHAQSHIWTVGEIAEITIPVAEMEPRPSSISFLNTGAFVTRHHEQELIVEVNGKEIRRHFYSVGNNSQIIEIPLSNVDLAKIEFKIPNAISPLDLGIRADKRKLGISFGEVHFNF